MIRRCTAWTCGGNRSAVRSYFSLVSGWVDRSLFIEACRWYSGRVRGLAGLYPYSLFQRAGLLKSWWGLKQGFLLPVFLSFPLLFFTALLRSWSMIYSIYISEDLSKFIVNGKYFRNNRRKQIRVFSGHLGPNARLFRLLPKPAQFWNQKRGKLSQPLNSYGCSKASRNLRRDGLEDHLQRIGEVQTKPDLPHSDNRRPLCG